MSTLDAFTFPAINLPNAIFYYNTTIFTFFWFLKAIDHLCSTNNNKRTKNLNYALYCRCGFLNDRIKFKLGYFHAFLWL